MEGYAEGLKYLFIPDLRKLFDLTVWIKASNQVLFMISLGIGCNILFAASRKENENIYIPSFWIPIMTVSCGILCSVINFCFLGHLSYLIGVPIDDLPLKGTDLAFITYPSALASLPFPNLWAILFYIMMITLGIDSQVNLAYLVRI
jgi:SNF family Na+-dependent transporter